MIIVLLQNTPKSIYMLILIIPQFIFFLNSFLIYFLIYIINLFLLIKFPKLY